MFNLDVSFRFAGVLFDVQGNYLVAFLVCAVLQVTGGVCPLLIFLFQKRDAFQPDVESDVPDEQNETTEPLKVLEGKETPAMQNAT